MSMGVYYRGASGVDFKSQVVEPILVDGVRTLTEVDLSAASSIEIYFRAPDGTELGPYTAESFEDDDDGDKVKARYTLDDAAIIALIDTAGTWQYWFAVEFSGGFVGPATPVTFEVR